MNVRSVGSRTDYGQEWCVLAANNGAYIQGISPNIRIHEISNFNGGRHRASRKISATYDSGDSLVYDRVTKDLTYEHWRRVAPCQRPVSESTTAFANLVPSARQNVSLVCDGLERVSLRNAGVQRIATALEPVIGLA